MNIIFLDMDGVLTSSRLYLASGDKGLWSSIDTHAARFIDRIADKWPAKIVISSTWRKSIEFNTFQYIFQGTGLFAKLHNHWKTPDLSKDIYSIRGDEINAWIKDNSFTGKYIILDDNEDFTDSQIKHNLILTDADDGMLTKHYKQILNKTNLHGKI